MNNWGTKILIVVGFLVSRNISIEETEQLIISKETTPSLFVGNVSSFPLIIIQLYFEYLILIQDSRGNT